MIADGNTTHDDRRDGMKEGRLKVFAIDKIRRGEQKRGKKEIGESS